MKNYKKRFLFLFIPLFICFLVCSKASRATVISAYDFHGDIKKANSRGPATTYVSDTLTRKELLTRIKKVLATQLDIKPETIKMQSRFTEDLGADDLSVVEIVMAFEEEFNISIPDADAETLTTVQKTYDYLIRKLKVKK